VSEWRTDNASFRIALSVLLRIVLICLLALTGCVARPKGLHVLGGTMPLIKIGLAASFEGLDRPLGYDALVGVKMALSERNAAGGVGGYMIELVALNDFGEPEEARLQAREFAADAAVMGVVTGWTGETARASLPVYQQAGLAVVVPWSVPPGLADRESGVILVAADMQRAAGKLAEAIAVARPGQVLVVGDEPSVALYQKSMGSWGPEVLVLSDSGESQDWASDLVQAQAQPPDALVLATSGVKAGEVLLALATVNRDVATFGGVEVGSVHLVSVGGSAADGLTFVSPAPAGRDVLQVEGNSALDTDELGPRAVLAYDATHVLLDAIDLAIREDSYPSRHGVVAALPRVQRHGLTGAIAFDVAGRRVDAPVWLYRIVDENYPGQALALPPAVSGE
jgi:branched-chain amino acid transport system substrate-binding protein